MLLAFLYHIGTFVTKQYNNLKRKIHKYLQKIDPHKVPSKAILFI